MFVKICGITNEDDALFAVAMGADAVGFVFAPSPRQVAAQTVYDITRRLPPEVLTVGVFRDEYVAWIQRAVAQPPELFGHSLGFYADFLEGVMLPGAPVLAPLILGFEVVLGLSLVVGLGVRLTASLGVVMMLAFNLAKPQRGDALDDPVGVYLFTVHSANWPVTLILLMLALGAAGRVLGLDAWLRARGPRWLRWIG